MHDPAKSSERINVLNALSQGSLTSDALRCVGVLRCAAKRRNIPHYAATQSSASCVYEPSDAFFASHFVTGVLTSRSDSVQSVRVVEVTVGRHQSPISPAGLTESLSSNAGKQTRP